MFQDLSNRFSKIPFASQVRPHPRHRLGWSAACAFAFSCLLPSETISAGQNCGLVFQACPGKFQSTVLQVPPEAIWLEPTFPACKDQVAVTIPAPAPPSSIVFIIDNSGSMSKDGKPADESNDPDEARFKVVQTLIDTLRAVNPKTEVGLVIFTRRLAFDHRDNTYFKTAFPSDTSQHDSYVPLTPLDQVFPGGVTGADTLKQLLKFTGEGNLIHHTPRPGSRPNDEYGANSTRDGTDITLGFEAAQVAMAAAKAPKENRYFIFLSDGEPASVDVPREGRRNDFVLGENMPTTFTVFFDNDDTPTAPHNIVRMTDNIRANGYSASNAKSAVWAINLPASQLLGLLQDKVIPTVVTQAPATTQGVSLSVSGLDYGAGVWRRDTVPTAPTEQFVFPKRIPLSPGTTSVDFTYTLTYADSGILKTKNATYSLAIRRDSAGSSILADSVALVCREAAQLALYRDGQAITRVSGDDTRLEARLTLPQGESCPGCSVQVQSSQGPDSESLLLLPTGSANPGPTYSAGFERLVSLAPINGNGKLEHAAVDSLILFHQNPENPLDRQRHSYPYTDALTVLKVEFPNPIARPTGPASLPATTTPAAWTLVHTDPQIAFVSKMLSAASTCCQHISPVWAAADSAHSVSTTIEASRGFAATLHIFTTTGEFVQRLDLTVPQSEFARLDPGIARGTRRLTIRWNAQAHNGRLVGTGSYIFRTAITLLPDPVGGAAAAQYSDTRRIGVLRGVH
jgi:hypothetical protein